MAAVPAGIVDENDKDDALYGPGCAKIVNEPPFVWENGNESDCDLKK